MSKKSFLFLQGPVSSFFKEIGNILKEEGHFVLRINFCLGDQIVWSGPDTISYRRKITHFNDFVRKIYAQHNITDVVIFSANREHHQIAIKVAHELGIRVVVTELGYLRPDWITLELNGMSGDSLMVRNPEKILALAANLQNPDLTRKYYDSFWYDAGYDILFNLSNTFFKLLFPFYSRHLVKHPVITYFGIFKHMMLRKFMSGGSKKIISRLSGEKYFLFPMQLDQDYQIRAYSKYACVMEVINELIESFSINSKNTDLNLLIKIHPLDPMLVSWKKKILKKASECGIQNQVFFIIAGDTDQLIKNAQGVVTINSTVGLTAIMAGTPVLTLGEAVYNIDGLVNNDKGLSAFWRNPTPPNKALMDAYLKLLVYTTQIKGGYFNKAGILNAARISARRLSDSSVNQVTTLV